MLNPFPQFLTYGFFAPTLLRLAIACIYLYLGARTWRRARHLGTVSLPIIGAQPWLPYLAGLAELCMGALFFVGLYTQIAAILSLIGMIKYAIYMKWWPKVLEEYIPLSSSTAALVFVISLSLLITGAGAMAFDIPL